MKTKKYYVIIYLFRKLIQYHIPVSGKIMRTFKIPRNIAFTKLLNITVTKMQMYCWSPFY